MLAACGGGSSSGNGSPDAVATTRVTVPDAGTATTATTPTPTPTPTPAGFSVTSNAIVTGTGGKAFSLKANFFDDGLVPANPVSNHGFHNPIISYVNADGSVDVAWLDYTGAGGQNAGGLSTPHAINITHINPDLGTGSTTATGLMSYKLLGFTRDNVGAYYIAYTADHPYKNTTAGDANNVNGNELKLAKSTSTSFAARSWDTLVFGDRDNQADLSKGNPGADGGGVLAYDAVNKKLLMYVAHQMAWGVNGTRHQAGYLRYVDPANGRLILPGNASDNMGTAWLYSHNFNQRLLIDNGTAYLLAHGDTYARQLGVMAYSYASYARDDSAVFNQAYLAIDGNQGDYATNAQTGQFVKLASGNLAIVHTTSQGRAARDVRIVLASSTDGTTKSSAWLTTNAANVQAIMPKLEAVGENLVLTYGLWNSSNRTNKTIEWRFALLDTNLKVLSTSAMAGVEFTAEAPLIRFNGGPNAGSVGWVSGNDGGSLSVHLIHTP